MSFEGLREFLRQQGIVRPVQLMVHTGFHFIDSDGVVALDHSAGPLRLTDNKSCLAVHFVRCLGLKIVVVLGVRFKGTVPKPIGEESCTY